MQINSRVIIFSLLATLVLSTSSAMAQAGPGKTRNQANSKSQIAARRPSADADHAAMKEVAKELGKAARIMKSALPIYSGHRHKSIEITKLAIRELRDAYKWSPNQAAKPTNLNQELARIGNGNEFDAAKYSADQIAKSNEKLKAGLEILVKAQNDIKKIQGNYGGNISNAAQLISLAIGEANQALQSVSRR